ncbi:hypothetical protein MFLAVUS_001872 [Mucor flavus]|uniref:SHSP domain-containing protein n=1 Tax=Mucor flavus TaxID=439312 RepID=A0ABP9YNR4_9FUNG
MQRAITSIMGSSHTSFPPTDTIETSDYYQLESELPGYKKQDVEVRVTNTHTLILTGSLHEDDEASERSTHRRMRQVHQEVEQAHSQEKQAEQERQQAQQEVQTCQASLADKVSSTESQSRLAEAKEAEMAKCKLAAQTQEKQVKESQAALETSQVHAQKVAQEAEEAKKKAESGRAATASSGPQGRKKSVLGHAKEFIDTQAENVQLEKKQAQVTDANKAAQEQQRMVEDAIKKAEQAQKEFQAMEAAKSKEVKDIKSQVQGGEAEAQKLKEEVQVKQEQASIDGHDKACGDNKASGGQEEHQKPVKAHYLSVERNVVERFSREFTFASSIEGDQVNATLQNGVLQVLVPKSKTGSIRQVNID